MAATLLWDCDASSDQKPQENTLEDLFVFGYACKLFRDDAKAKSIDEGKHLIPWMGDDRHMIDRSVPPSSRTLLGGLATFGLLLRVRETKFAPNANDFFYFRLLYFVCKFIERCHTSMISWRMLIVMKMRASAWHIVCHTSVFRPCHTSMGARGPTFKITHGVQKGRFVAARVCLQTTGQHLRQNIWEEPLWTQQISNCNTTCDWGNWQATMEVNCGWFEQQHGPMKLNMVAYVVVNAFIAGWSRWMEPERPSPIGMTYKGVYTKFELLSSC